jgi:Chondroitinase B
MDRTLHLPRFASIAALAAASLAASPALAGNALQIPGAPALDPPTVTALGVQLLVTGDDNHDATVTLRYRPSGAMTWRDALPLFRVHPEVVTGYSVQDQFAGSIFDLSPGTAYEIELHATDPDGPVDQTLMLMGTTRAVPALDPKAPSPKTVTDAASLASALNAAQAGDVITLKKGTYAGTFSCHADGTADNPVVIRGESEDEVILDGGGDGGNVLEIYGSFVHVERITIQNANRALRFQGQGAEANVVRRVHIKDTVLGIGSKPDQKDFYLCDNILEGRLAWPAVYADDGGAHANDDGIHLEGNGHVVCHNQIKGYGDAMKIEQDGARADDFYNNEVLSAYDNGLELDASSGNTRCLRNRFTNTYATLSFQPIFGGPVYAIRNVIVNVANEQMKFHALGTVPPEEPSGIFALHNTFVSSNHALNLQTSAASHYFTVENNLFIGPASPDQGKTVDWTGVVDHGTFDYNGYFPEGVFAWNLAGQGYTKFPSFAAAQAGGLEKNGILAGAMNFASGLATPADYKAALPAPDVTLAASSLAIDKGTVLANVNDGFNGKAPDLGAIEVGCKLPVYGVRPEGVDETNEMSNCSGSTGAGGSSATGSGGGAGTGMSAATGTGSETGTGTGAGGGGGGSAAPGSKGGCGCRAAPVEAEGWAGAIAIAAAIGIARRRRARR